MSAASSHFSPHGYSSDISSDYYHVDPIENECLEHYENNLEKYKDERDAIQKKTFTKWVNKHLGKTGRQVNDLFVDLSDGFNLIALLEALSAERLPRENGYTRFHRIQNVQYCLDFLRKKNIKTVNIRPEDIVEGNSKLTLGLIWTIILNFQVSVIKQRQLESTSCQVSDVLTSTDGVSARDALLQWAQEVTRGYPGVSIRNFTSSWRDGLAFNAILHRYRPKLIHWNGISRPDVTPRQRLANAFNAAESEFSVSRLLDPEDVDVDSPDEKSIITYVSSLYQALPHDTEFNRFEQDMDEYERQASEWLHWVQKATQLMKERSLPSSAGELRRLLEELDQFKNANLPPKAEERQRLTDWYSELYSLFEGTSLLRISPELSSQSLATAWQRLQKAMEERVLLLEDRAGTVQGSMNDIVSRLQRGINITNEKLDHILTRIEEVDKRVENGWLVDLQTIVDGIIDDLTALESPIAGFFEDVEQLKQCRHPEAADFSKQVFGLEQRRMAYISKLQTQFVSRLGVREEMLLRQTEEKREYIRRSTFAAVDQCIKWVRERIEKLSTMEFVEDLTELERMFEEHKVDNHNIQEFRQNVDECIARQAEVPTEDTHEYCELLSTLESEYQQLRDLSAGRMLDLDSLIAFVRGAQEEIKWINKREDHEVTRNWSDINRLDLPMLRNYYKQILQEMELRETSFNDVHNKGAALLNQGHPAIRVIEFYLSAMREKWDWLLSLTKCFEQHLKDAINLSTFLEDAKAAEEWMNRQMELLERKYDRHDFSLEEGEQILHELDEISELIRKYHSVLMALMERSAQMSPLWQRGERIQRPIPVTALADYTDRNITIRERDECTLLDNSDLIHWVVRGADARESTVPSVVFRVPPPDSRLTTYLRGLQTSFDKLRRIWEKKHRMVRFNMVLNTMAQIRGWDLDTFMSIEPEVREQIIKALNDDAQKLLSELDPNDPMALRLSEELRLTNEHYYNLLNESMRPKEPDLGSVFDERLRELLEKLEQAYNNLNERASQGVPRSMSELEKLLGDHKNFEDILQNYDVEVSNIKELFRQLPNPTPSQRANHELLNNRWADLWQLSQMYVERLKVLERVLRGMSEVSDMVREHEITLNSFDDLPAALDRLRGVHSQLLKMHMVLKQQQNVVDTLNHNIAVLRQHIARTRQSTAHPDVDRLEDDVQNLTVRWENVCGQVADRLKTAEEALQTQMVYRSAYDNEISWLDRVEATINGLRRPEDMRPEQYQQQLDVLLAEYAQLQERTEAIENVNREGGKFIRQAKGYDADLEQYSDDVARIHGPKIRDEFRRTKPQPKNGAQKVTEELEALNRRLAQLSSFILERRNIMQVLIQNWKRQKQEDVHNECLKQQADMTIFLEMLNGLGTSVTSDIGEISSPQDAASVQKQMEDLRRELKANATNIERSIREADRLCMEGADMLTPEQFHALKEHRNQLETTYMQLLQHSDLLLERLNDLTKLLLEFTSTSSTFHSYITGKTREIATIKAESGNLHLLEESAKKAEYLEEDVLSSSAQLGSISALLSRVQAALDDYVAELRAQYPNLEIAPMDAPELSNTLSRIQSDFDILVRNCGELRGFLDRLHAVSDAHTLNVDSFSEGLTEIEQQLIRAKEAVASTDTISDSASANEILSDLEALQALSFEQASRLDALARSAAELDSALVGTDAQERIALENKRLLDDLGRRQNRARENIEENVDAWRSKMARSEGLREGIKGILDWLNAEGEKIKEPKSLPLSLDKLTELRREEELAHRDLISRQKVLADFGSEIFRNVAPNSPAAANSQLVEQYRKADAKFTPLVQLSKALCANTADLCGMLLSMSEDEKSLKDKLSALERRFENTSPLDTAELEAISRELDDLVDNDWVNLQKQQKRILAMPNVAETEALGKSMDSIQSRIEDMFNKMAGAATQSEKLADLRSVYEARREDMAKWLSDMKKKADELEKIPLDEVELSNQRNFCEQLQSEHRERQPEMDDFRGLGTELIEMETIARIHAKAPENVEEPQTRLREITAIGQQYDHLAGQLKAKSEKICSTSEKLGDWYAARNGLAQWAAQEARLLEVECPVALNRGDIQANLAKVSRLEKVVQREKQPIMEEIKAKARNLLNDSSVTGAEEILSAQKDLESVWDALNGGIESVKQQADTSKQLLQGWDDLDKCLKQKERMLSINEETVNPDPKVIGLQISQLEFLSSEMNEQENARNRLNDLAHDLVKNSDGAASQQIVEKMDDLNLRWVAFNGKLKGKEEKLAKAKEASTQFTALQRDIRSALLDIAEDVEKASRCPLTDAKLFDEHLKKLDELEEKGNNANEKVNELRVLADSINQLIPGVQTEVTEQLNGTVQFANELSKKIESLRNATLNAKKAESETAKEVENTLKWLKGVKNQLNDVGAVSADPRVLADQANVVEELYSDVLDKEGDIALLRAKLNEQLKKGTNPQLKAVADALYSEWVPVLNETKSKHAAVERVSNLVKQLEDSLDGFSQRANVSQERLKELTVSEPGAAKDLEQQIEHHYLELQSLEPLITKLEDATGGKSANALRRRLENAQSDWKVLVKDARNASAKLQNKKELKNRFDKCKLEAAALLNSGREVSPLLQQSAVNGAPTSSVGANKDAVFKAISDLKNGWQRQNKELNSTAKDLQAMVDPEEAAELKKTIDGLEAEYQDLIGHMEREYEKLDEKEKEADRLKRSVTEFGDSVRGIKAVGLTPIGLRATELEQQKLECNVLLETLDKKDEDVKKLTAELKEQCDAGVITPVQLTAALNQLCAIRSDLEEQKKAVSQRKRKISSVQQSVCDVEREVESICADVNELLSEDILRGPIKPELSDLRSQQEDLRVFREKLRRQIGDRVDQAVSECDKLIKTADKQADVSELELERKKLVDAWNEISNSLAEREKQICGSIQELGSYADAYNALLIWLEDTEESLDNQQPPSTEYKVVKAQSSANDILLKHIEEKQPSIDGFKALMDKVEALATDEPQRNSLREKSEDVTKRYAALLEHAQARRAQLHDALQLAEEWSHLSGPLSIWLDATEKSVQQLGKIPVNEEVMQEQLDIHQELQKSINEKRGEFDRLVDLCPRLAELTSEKEAGELENSMHGLTSRYENLETRVSQCGTLLQQLAEDIGSFLEHTSALSEWLERMEDDIDKVHDISIYPEELIDQSSALTELAMEVTEQEPLVSRVVEDGRELCKHTSGDKAIVLQSRIEGLRSRYLELAAITDSKIALLSEALPLAERFQDGCESVQQWMDAVEQDMQDIDQVPLEAQSALVAQIEDDMNKWRADVDEINGISKQLQQLSRGPRADELDVQTDDLNRRFNMLAEQVTRKAEKLSSAEKQSRQVLDELDYLNGWFADASDRLKQASAPAVDPDYVRKQLKNQKLMNEDIAVMRARLRDAAADAQKVTRNLGDEADGQNALLASKIETGRELSAEVTQLGEKRLGDLEQALALCQEVEQSFGELHGWLESIEGEIENSSSVSTGIQRDEMLKQLALNTELQQSIQSQKPLLDRFEKNVAALSELCDAEDAVQLEKIAEGLEERYEEVRNAVEKRAVALENAIEHSSQFTDRLDVILAKLGGAAAQIRNPDPVSADPERIRSQISDNLALKEELKLKEGALQTVKESADVILKQARPNDPAVAEISAKIEKLDLLWQELNDGVEERGNVLENTLAKAERFWAELEKCQTAIEELRLRIMEIQPAAGQPSVIEQQRSTLLAIEGNLHDTEPLVNELRLAGMDLCSVVAVEERAHVEQQLGVVEGNWSTVTDLYARKNTDLVDAMEKAMDFHGLYSELLEWLVDTEGKMAEFARTPQPSSAGVKNELAALDVLKTILDEKMVQKERLNQLCANLCAGATVQQSAAIRAPINDLNNRWNRLYATLNDRQQKMERALLEMGQFSQAYDQLMGWIDNANNALDMINPRPSNLKQVEIEVCKYKVQQNDIRAHEASIETLNNAAKRIIAADPNSTAATQPMVDELNARWHALADKLDNIWTQLTGAREAAENLGGEMDKWSLWLQDKDADLSHAKPLAGLPETARAQLDDFLVLKAEIEQNRPELEAHLEASDQYLAENADNKDSWVAQRQGQLKKKWTQIQERLTDKEQKLRIALSDAEQLSTAMNSMNNWLTNAEERLGRLPQISRVPDALQEQVAEHSKFDAEVAAQRELMAELKSKGTKLQYLCEKKDAIPIKNNLVSARHRLDKIVSRCADRTKQLDNAMKDSNLFFDAHGELTEWIGNSAKWIDDSGTEALFGENIRGALDRHKDFQRELGSRQPMFETTYKRGKNLMDHAPKTEQAKIGDMNEDLRKKWTQLCTASVQRQRDIEEALLESGQFDDALSSLREWLEKTLPDVESRAGEPVHGDVETVNQFVEENRALKEEIDSRQASVDSVKQRAEQMLNAKKDDDGSTEGLREKLNQLNADWRRLETIVEDRDEDLKEALEEAEKFGNEARAILDWLPRIEDRLRMKGQKPETESEILDQMDEVAQVRKEMDDEATRLDNVLALGHEILGKCHPSAEQNMKYWLKILQTRWDEVSQMTDAKRDDLEKQLSDLHEQDELIAKLLKFINAKEEDLKILSGSELPMNMDEIEKLIEDHEHFDSSLREKQDEVSSATLGRRIPALESEPKTKTKKPTSKKEKPVRHPKADMLSDKWNRLWLDSVEYGSRLRKMKAHLEELKKLESFTFEEWRERYLEWTDSGKARISDLFRRIDKSGTGRVPRNAFIDEILRSKFPTTRLEMERVADEFDKGDGMIDSKEFMARLRSDFAKKLPVKQKTEGEKINEEVQRQSEKCCCHTPYKIQKVGEGHYRFGDTQIKRMVRILRSTVMVRVGGGWVALDEFLHKHDPCRAKGRTNIDLQRGFYNDVRPINAHDSMETFTKSKPGSNRGSPVPVPGEPLGHHHHLYAATPGPITKIREKTERSMPMHSHSGNRTPNTSQMSLNDGSFLPRRTSDVSMQDSRFGRPGVSSNVSRSSSRGDVYDTGRPSSRCSESSDLSERPTRIPSLRGRKGVNYRPSSARNSPHP